MSRDVNLVTTFWPVCNVREVMVHFASLQSNLLDFNT